MMMGIFLLLWASSTNTSSNYFCRLLALRVTAIHGFAPPTGSLSSRASRFHHGYNNPIMRLSTTTNDNSTALVSSSTSALATKYKRIKKRKKRTKGSAEKRSEFIGLAKAVDRGSFPTYKPRGTSGNLFVAKSGLPRDISPTGGRLFTVLGIESSCDDTGAAVVRSDGKILGESLASQSHIHEEWGGVVPALARTAHEENIDKVIYDALQKAQTTLEEIDAIGVTVGPGLEICLRVGCEKACQLATEYGKPFVGVHHLEAHILMARIENPELLQFPFLALLTSGGHCQLLKCLGIACYEIIGGTIDDSLGECYDKTARLLGLPVGGGGGPALEALAKEGNATSIPLTIPLHRRQDCDFSYAGLKTNIRRAAEQLAVDRNIMSVLELSRKDKADLAASFQNTAIKHLEQRLERAMKIMEKEEINSLALVGGVAANQELRSRLNAVCERRNWNMVVPPPRLCTDQGAMASWAAIERLRMGSSDDPSSQKVYARYPFLSYSDIS